MKNQFHTRLLLLFLSTTLVIAGCIAFGAKKTLLVAQQTKTKAIEQPITVENQPKTLCPKLKSGSHNYTTFNFLYVLDTTDKNCIATKWQDLFGEEKLFPIQKDVNLVFEGKQPGGSIYSACRFQEDHNYVQYYKGIKVEGSRIMLTYDKGKIVRLVGTYYPHLNIDTTGMLSKEEAAMLVLKERNTPAEAYTRTIQYMLNYSDLKVDPIRQRITYSFWFILGEKSGTYVVNALTGLVESHTPYKFAHVCYKCAADSINAIANTTTCSTLCTTKLDSTFIDHRMVVVPTLYNDCQAIYADSCKVGDTIVYRLSPLLLDSLGSISYKINDTINIVDASVLDAGGAPLFQEVKYCYNDSILSGKSAAANSIFYGMKLAKEYFQSKNIDDNKRLHVWAHLPFPLNNYAGYSLISKIFIFGDGDSITFNPFVSADIIAHEYGHSVLHRKFNIGSHVTDTLHINRYEAGALHEGIADIFSVLVRKHAYGTINWVIGDDVVIPTSTTLLPRDLAHPQNTTPPQALYYNDPAANWDTTQTEIYNHAGIIAKWFYLLSNGGMGYYYATDSITVEPLTIDTAEMVLIKGLDTLSRDSIKIPSFEKFAVAMAAAAQTISCTAHKQTIRALKAVGLGLNIPGGKTTLLTEDESLCFIDLRMRDCYNDQGFEPNTECDDWLGWNDIWNSPDIWVCPQNDSCYLAASAPPEPAYSNRIGFTIYNAHPNLISDPAQLHLYYTMASSGELWDFNWIDWYFTAGDYTCYLGDEIATSPVTIPAINPSSFFTGWTTWTPPNFVNPNLPFYAHPDSCWILPEIDPLDGELKYEICLLARLLSEADPIRHEIYDNIAHNVIYNNNIVTKNLFFLNPGLGVGGGTPPAIAGNPSVMLIANNNATTANLNIVYQQLANGLGLQGANDSIEISLILSPTLWSNWVSTGQQSQGITLLTQREVRIDNYQTAKLLNIPFVAYERQPIAIKTTILTNGNKTTYWQNNLNNIEFKFSVFHEAATNTAINPSSNCMFVLKNYHPVNNSPRDAIQLICTPNPVTTGWGKLQMYVPQPVTVSIALFNLSGIKVQQILSNQHYQSGLHQIPFNITNLPNGMYICQLNTQTKTVATKIIKLTN